MDVADRSSSVGEGQRAGRHGASTLPADGRTFPTWPSRRCSCWCVEGCVTDSGAMSPLALPSCSVSRSPSAASSSPTHFGRCCARCRPQAPRTSWCAPRRRSTTPAAEHASRPRSSSEVRAFDGVAAAAGTVAGQAIVIAPDGTPSLGRFGAPVGVAWVDDPRVAPVELREGTAPAPGQVVLDRRTAERTGVEVGSTVGIVAAGPVEQFAVAGVGEAPDGAGAGPRQPDPVPPARRDPTATRHTGLRLGARRPRSRAGVGADDRRPGPCARREGGGDPGGRRHAGAAHRVPPTTRHAVRRPRRGRRRVRRRQHVLDVDRAARPRARSPPRPRCVGAAGAPPRAR